jgi:hypothetical protein
LMYLAVPVFQFLICCASSRIIRSGAGTRHPGVRRIGHEIFIATHLMFVLLRAAAEEPVKIHDVLISEESPFIKILLCQCEQFHRGLAARPETHFLLQAIIQEDFRVGNLAALPEGFFRSLDLHQLLQGEGDMFTGSQVIDTEIRAGTVIVARRFSPDGNLVGLL